ncbi:hypothetical protein MPLB_1510119 [Mesorhizobium sp. ORS 3324]|nr:hypothetical protein MPLB_1510119 [Mesorhizobium sp. ORS 3324]
MYTIFAPGCAQRKADIRRARLERFTVSRKRRTALSFCFDAFPDGKPSHTFPGIALSEPISIHGEGPKAGAAHRSQAARKEQPRGAAIFRSDGR